MSSRRLLLHRAARTVESVWDAAYGPLRPEPRHLSVVPYLGHGNRDRAILRGRVLAGTVAGPAQRIESLPRRVSRMVRRFATAELPGVEVELTAGHATTRVVTDDEGYYRAELVDHGLPADRSLHQVAVTLHVSPDVEVVVHPARVMIPTSRARRMIVSDIDDTVLHSQATDRVQLLRNTLTGSALTRRGYPGTAALFEGLKRGPDLAEDNPVLYVSSSPWNLYDFLMAFLRRSALPVGPMFLRDMGVEQRAAPDRGHRAHKGAALQEIMEIHDLPAVLIGDTGEEDPGIYRDIAERDPGRVGAILLRHAGPGPGPRDSLAGLRVPTAVGQTTTALAGAVVSLMPPGWLDRVADDL